jgi:hypothetical protein
MEGLTSNKLEKLLWYKNKTKIKTQLDLYIENNSPKPILRLVKMSNKSFGSESEKIAYEYFNMQNRSDTTHDFIKCDFKIELKSARYNSCGKLDFRWQHIDHIHEWDFLLLCAVEFDKIRYFISSNIIIQKLIDSNKITGQGKLGLPKQGYWFSLKKIKNFDKYFSEIFDEKTLIKYITSYP